MNDDTGQQGPQQPQPQQQPPSQPPTPAAPPGGFLQQAQERAQFLWASFQRSFTGFPLWGKIGTVAGIIVLFCAVCGGCVNGLAGGAGTSARTPTAAQQHTAAPKGPTATHGPTATPTPSYAHFGDGMFKVGTDIKPGTYRTRSGSSGCYFARLKGFSGSFDDIIANDNTDGPAVVTIAANDAGFQSQNCGTWTQDLSQVTKSKTSFEDGTYIVGTDIEPGTYKNTGDDSCYWQRLRDFSASFNGIIANGNPTGAAIVTIKASDKGFSAARCGTWTKQ